jgi:hypothetical protein
MAVGYESQQVNGQLVNVAPGQGYAPLTFGSMYTGPGMWPRNGVFNVPPVTPAPGSTGQGGTTATGLTAGAGSPSGDSSPVLPTSGTSNGATANFLHPTKSPVLWAIGFLALSLFMLHKVHFKGV